ncbi:MAG: class I SAM-dependent methyltransferase [Chloroflexi bacterium]|nr:class I SAM-dependent methyltransferase [Chloroflexota bacterium]
MERYTDYDDFAPIYNRHWGSFSTHVLPVLDQLALSDFPTGTAILDLCCGTGQLARELTGRGYKVTGVDGSEQMLQYARLNAPKARFSNADARFFQLPVDFALVFSTYDSLNHLLTLDDLAKVFRSVYNHLQTGGVFIFDMNLDSGFRSRWVGTFQIVSDASVVVLAAEYDEDEKLATMNIASFSPSEDDKTLWRRKDIVLTQRAYSVDELTRALASAGFTNIEVFDARRDFGMRDDGRAFFRARKA